MKSSQVNQSHGYGIDASTRSIRQTIVKAVQYSREPMSATILQNAVLWVRKAIEIPVTAINSFNSSERDINIPGSFPEHPLELLASPGLMTLLDVALLQQFEAQLTGTLTASHALLSTWLELRMEAVDLWRDVQKLQQDQAELGHFYSVAATAQRQNQLQSLARLCLECSCEAISFLTTDGLASSANLSDAYPNIAEGASSSGGGGNILSSTSCGTELIDKALSSGVNHTGRLLLQYQRRKDCWESPRLHCPDAVWGEAVLQANHSLLKQKLHKHPLCVELWNNGNDMANISLTSNCPSSARSSSGTAATGSGGLSGGTRYKTLSEELLLERLQTIWLLLKTDLPTRLFQLRAALEADSCVLKRLYLIKCEGRAPFRAYLDAHHAVQRAPSLALVDEYLGKLASSKEKGQRALFKAGSSDSSDGQAELAILLKNPVLIESLALEERCAVFEREMAQVLLPFCELARCLHQKRAQLTSSRNELPSVNNKRKQPFLTQRQLLKADDRCKNRLRGLLIYSYHGGHHHHQSQHGGNGQRVSGDISVSSGIRPLLLDLQGVPRDEYALLLLNASTGDKEVDKERASQDFKQTELDSLIEDLSTLAALCSSRTSFRDEQRDPIDIPSSILHGCTQGDLRQFRCHMKDWQAMVDRQNILCQENDLEDLSEKMRHAELQSNLAGATRANLSAIRPRLEALSTDRDTRLQVLRDMMEEVCLRELNMFVSVQASSQSSGPLPATPSAPGVFGRALQLAGIPLPVG